MFKNILFDLDGTIIDKAGSIYENNFKAINDLNKKIESSFNKLQEVVTNEDKCREIVFTS